MVTMSHAFLKKTVSQNDMPAAMSICPPTKVNECLSPGSGAQPILHLKNYAFNLTLFCTINLSPSSDHSYLQTKHALEYFLKDSWVQKRTKSRVSKRYLFVHPYS